MCTVSIVPAGDGFRLVSNRDERRARARARPPRWYDLGGRRALFPLDPEGGGSWVGVNDVGLAAALLNRSPGSPVPAAAGAAPIHTAATRPAASRGLIVPLLLSAASLRDAQQLMRQLPRRRFQPFRVVVVQAGHVTFFGADREWSQPLEVPVVLASSSLGDDLVETHRRALFERLWRADRAHPLDVQRRFHRHQWAAHPELSVVMSRPDARTVSRTTCDVRGHCAGLAYEALPECDPVRARTGGAVTAAAVIARRTP